MKRVIGLFTIWIICGTATGCAAKQRIRHAHAQGQVFIATAHSQHGRSASGETTRKGTVAADPKVLPLGSTILVSRAGRYSGKYKVIDTGPGVRGRRIDIYVDTLREARRFGRRRVVVKVLNPGDKIEYVATSP